MTMWDPEYSKRAVEKVLRRRKRHSFFATLREVLLVAAVLGTTYLIVVATLAMYGSRP